MFELELHHGKCEDIISKLYACKEIVEREGLYAG